MFLKSNTGNRHTGISKKHIPAGRQHKFWRMPAAREQERGHRRTGNAGREREQEKMQEEVGRGTRVCAVLPEMAFSL